MSTPSPIILITGCFGFLGRHVAHEFSDQGWHVVGLGHHGMAREDMDAWGVDAAIVDDISVGLIADAVEMHGIPQVIFHAAGGASVGKSWQDTRSDFARTVATTEEVIEATRCLPDRPLPIYSSSAAVYGIHHLEPICEDDELRPIPPYDLNILLAEEPLCGAVRLYGIRCAVIRFFSLYGAEPRKQILWDICCRIAQGEDKLTLGGQGNEARDFLSGPYTARIVYALRDFNGDDPLIVNGAQGIPTSVAELANGLLAALGLDIEVEFSGEMREGDPPYLVADTSRATGLGFTPRWSLSQGLQGYAAWIRNTVGGLPADAKAR